MSEESEAKRDGTRLQRNSGRGKYAKGDGIRPLFLVDYKEAQKSFALNSRVWSKVCSDTYSVDPDLSPQLRIILGTDKKVRLSIIETSMLDYMESRIIELEAKIDKT
jgi:hypothetical protein